METDYQTLTKESETKIKSLETESTKQKESITDKETKIKSLDTEITNLKKEIETLKSTHQKEKDIT